MRRNPSTATPTTPAAGPPSAGAIGVGTSYGAVASTARSALRFSEELESWLESDEPKTLGGMGGLFGEKSFAVTIMLLMIVPAIPLPTGGVTHVFEAITVLLAAQMVLGRRTIWLPERWHKRELGDTVTGKAIPFIVRWVQRVERISRPRCAWLFGQRWMLRLLGLLLMAFAIGAAFAPPFSGLDTFPAMGAVVVSLAIILEDVIVLAIGTVIGAGGIVLIFTIGTALVHLIQNLL